MFSVRWFTAIVVCVAATSSESAETGRGLFERARATQLQRDPASAIELFRKVLEQERKDLELAAPAWGAASCTSLRAIDYHITNLRKKIEKHSEQPRHILSVHGIGYKFVP